MLQMLNMAEKCASTTVRSGAVAQFTVFSLGFEMAGAVAAVELGRCMFVACPAGCQKFYPEADAPRKCEVCTHHAGSHEQPKVASAAPKPAATAATPAVLARTSKLSNLRAATKPATVSAAASAGSAAPASAARVAAPAAAKIQYSWEADAKAASAVPLVNAGNQALVDDLAAAAERLADGTSARARIEKLEKRGELKTDADRDGAHANIKQECAALADSYWRVVAIIRPMTAEVTSADQMKGAKGVGSGPMFERIRSALVRDRLGCPCPDQGNLRDHSGSRQRG
jgi:hypothetical protein